MTIKSVDYKTVAEFCGHQRHHRWAHRRHRSLVSSWAFINPRFVLNELLSVISADNLRDSARRMEVLSELQKDPAIPVTISDIDVEGVREVDERLIVLAHQSCPILTNDYS